jgi:hypothetical protein
VAGDDYLIDSDFRTALRFFELQRDTRVMDRHKGYVALKMFFRDRFPADQSAAFERMGWFIRCGKPEEQAKQRKPEFDFCHDSGIIFSSFWEQYGIDLSTASLHWWKFSALFTGLGEHTMFRQVISIRTRREDGLDAASKAELREAKRIWALPAGIFKPQRDNALAAALLKGDAQAIQRALK